MSFPRILHWLGLLACIGLVVACFLPWTYYRNDPMMTEAQRTFTGFYSFENYYGKPGKFLTVLAAISFIMKLLPRVWAKRTDLVVSVLAVAYAARCWAEYTGYYNGITPEKQAGIFIMALSAILMLIAAVFPDLKLVEKRK